MRNETVCNHDNEDYYPVCTECGVDSVYETRHEVRDAEKVRQIAASLEAEGWIGAAVVIYHGGTDIAITGVHRLAACAQIGIYPVTMDLADVFNEAGLDLPSIEIECDYDIPSMIAYLPADIADKFGIEQ